MIPLLYAPEQYWRLARENPEALRKIVNGCGTAGWKGKLVPDTIWGLNIEASCGVHDFMYHIGETLADKEEADRVFLNNMLRQIEAAGGWEILQALRRRRAHTYYLAVVNFGGPAFWSGKNAEAHLGLAAAAA